MTIYHGSQSKIVTLMSKKAFDALTYAESVTASAAEYFERYKERDTKARSEYRELKKESHPEEGTYVMDIIRQKWENSDARLY